MTENEPGTGPNKTGQPAPVPSPINTAGQSPVPRQPPIEAPSHQPQVQAQPQQWPVLQQPQHGYVQAQQPYPAPMQQQRPQQWAVPQAQQRAFMQPQQPYLPQQPQGAYAPAQQWAGQPQQPYIQAPPQIIINNVTTANANVAATNANVMARGGYRMRKQQSFWIHVLLFLTTVGLGNILYAWYVIDWNNKHGF